MEFIDTDFELNRSNVGTGKIPPLKLPVDKDLILVFETKFA